MPTGSLRVVGATTAAAVLAVLLPSTPAAADPIDSAVSALRTGSVYVGADRPKIEQARLGGDTLTGIKVAIVPNGGPDPVSVAKSIGARLDPKDKGLTVLVFEGHSYGVASSARCGAGTAIDDAVSANKQTLETSDDVTSTVADFASAARKAPSAANGCSGPATENVGFGKDASTPKPNHTGLIAFLVIAALLAGAIAYVVHSRRRKARRILSDARAEAMPYFDRLSAEVSQLDPRDNATQTARTALGLQPGPQLPSMGRATGEPQLNEPRLTGALSGGFGGSGSGWDSGGGSGWRDSDFGGGGGNSDGGSW